MQPSALIVLAIAAGTAASHHTTTWYPTTRAVSSCGSQVDLIIETCLNSTEPQLLTCLANDWDCRCTHSINVLSCYNNCMSDPDRFGSEQTKVANCNAASAYGTASKTTATATVSSISTLSTMTAIATSSPTSHADNESSTKTESVSASDTTVAEAGSAVIHAALPASGLFAAMFGLAASM